MTNQIDLELTPEETEIRKRAWQLVEQGLGSDHMTLICKLDGARNMLEAEIAHLRQQLVQAQAVIETIEANL